MKKEVCMFCKEEGHTYLVDCPKYKEQKEIAEKEKKEWKEQHEVCPDCGGKHYSVTFAGPIHIVGEGFEDNINDFNCVDCGRKGKVNELKPK